MFGTADPAITTSKMHRSFIRYTSQERVTEPISTAVVVSPSYAYS